MNQFTVFLMISLQGPLFADLLQSWEGPLRTLRNFSLRPNARLSLPTKRLLDRVTKYYQINLVWIVSTISHEESVKLLWFIRLHQFEDCIIHVIKLCLVLWRSSIMHWVQKLHLKVFLLELLNLLLCIIDYFFDDLFLLLLPVAEYGSLRLQMRFVAWT